MGKIEKNPNFLVNEVRKVLVVQTHTQWGKVTAEIKLSYLKKKISPDAMYVSSLG